MATLIFGPFQLDTRALELKRAHRKVALRPQPCRVLALLAGRAGQLVTRQDIRQSVWPVGVHVRFDLGLNSCLKQIRHALGEFGSDWVETLPGRGYRFLAPVTVDEDRDRRPRLTLLAPQTADARTRPVADGLAGELLTQLAQTTVSRLAVIDGSVVEGRSSERAAVLGAGTTDVDLLLQWRVRTDAQRVRVTMQMLGARELRIIWAGAFEELDGLSLAGQVRLATVVATAVARAVDTSTLLPELRTHFGHPVHHHAQRREGTRLLDHREREHVLADRTGEHQRRVRPH